MRKDTNLPRSEFGGQQIYCKKIQQILQKWHKKFQNWYKISEIYEKLPKCMKKFKIAAIPSKFAAGSTGLGSPRMQ